MAQLCPDFLLYRLIEQLVTRYNDATNLAPHAARIGFGATELGAKTDGFADILTPWPAGSC
jgi:hypothetical protein